MTRTKLTRCGCRRLENHPARIILPELLTEGVQKSATPGDRTSRRTKTFAQESTQNRKTRQEEWLAPVASYERKLGGINTLYAKKVL